MGLACSWFTQVRGTDPQRGGEVDEWACAIAWLPMLSINTAQQVAQGAAATESLRNTMVDMHKMGVAQQGAIASLLSVATTVALKNGEQT